LKNLALAFLTACVYWFLSSLKKCISRGLSDANAERHRMFLCWSRADCLWPEIYQGRERP
jgi:hypothetical protein